MHNSPFLYPALHAPARHRGLALLLVLVLTVSSIFTACQVVPPFSSPRATTAGAAQGGTTVPLQILEDPEGGILATLPVFINKQGPFTFILDTGSASSLIDTPIAIQLGLEAAGPSQQISGVAGTEIAQPVHVTDWQAGDVVLPPTVATAASLLGGSTRGSGRSGRSRQPVQSGSSLQGLLGSNVFSTYGTVTVDYANQLLILGPATCP